MTSARTHRTAADDVNLLLDVLPVDIREAIREKEYRNQLIEVVLDLGRPPEARFPDHVEELSSEGIHRDVIAYVVERVGTFTADNRAGIEQTLHRISAIRNRIGAIVGLTCRVGRAVFGTVDIVRDVVESGTSLLLLGRPGVGKTTLLRESARVLADELDKRVIIVDTSNEIGGDGDVPHPGIGRARRMQVPSPAQQHAVMIEAVENHMPEVIVIDEIGTAAEATAARTIAERGVQLIATAHGNTLENLLQNPMLSDLVGGVQVVTISDEEARRRRTQKTILERKAPPTFNSLVEIQKRDQLAVYHDVATMVDAFLRGFTTQPEIRVRTDGGAVVVQKAEASAKPAKPSEPSKPALDQPLHVYTYGVDRSRLERAIDKYQVPVRIVTDLNKADVVLTLKSKEKRISRKLRDLHSRSVSFHALRTNTISQMEHFLRSTFQLEGTTQEREDALREAEEAANEVYAQQSPVELTPRDARLRALQHEIAEQYGLTSKSKGKEPQRRVVLYPS